MSPSWETLSVNWLSVASVEHPFLSAFCLFEAYQENCKRSVNGWIRGGNKTLTAS